MSKKIIYALFNDDEVVLDVCKELVSKGVFVRDVYSPFPIHGLDPVIGIKKTRLGIMSFIYGMMGVTLALTGMYYMMIYDWPMIIGGKPNFTFIENLPAFIPVTFEFGVLCAAHLMAITFLIRSKVLPFSKARNPFPETTNDHFAVEIREEDNHGVNMDEVLEILKNKGAVKIEQK
jgi:hypothetical protein